MRRDTIIYTCDNCGAEQEQPDASKTNPDGWSWLSKDNDHAEHVCTLCLDAVRRSLTARRDPPHVPSPQMRDGSWDVRLVQLCAEHGVIVAADVLAAHPATTPQRVAQALHRATRKGVLKRMSQGHYALAEKEAPCPSP